MARAVAVSISIRRGTIAAMLNEISGTPPSEPPANRKPWYRFRPHPASAVVWLYALLLMWYAAPRGPFFPKPGTVITAHYPQVLEYGKMLLAAYWACAAVAFGAGALRGRPRSLLRTLEVVLAVLVAVFGGAYAAARLGSSAMQDAALTLALVTSVPAILIGGALASPKRPRSALVPLALSLLVVCPLAYPEMPELWPIWQDVGQVRVPDGHTYHVQHKQMLQGSDYILTLEADRGLLFLRTRVVADAGDITSAWPVLVRPAGMHWDRRTLAASSDGRWLAYATESYPSKDTYSVRFAYDLRMKRLYRGDNRAQLSSFLLIGPDDGLDSRDVNALHTRIARPEVLERDARHPNPRVREVVRELRAGR
jgi:hypothetical protein